MKTQYQRGHFNQMKDTLVDLLTKLDTTYKFSSGSATEAEDSDAFEYIYYKFMYMKAKVLRKTR